VVAQTNHQITKCSGN